MKTTGGITIPLLFLVYSFVEAEDPLEALAAFGAHEAGDPCEAELLSAVACLGNDEYHPCWQCVNDIDISTPCVPDDPVRECDCVRTVWCAGLNGCQAACSFCTGQMFAFVNCVFTQAASTCPIACNPPPPDKSSDDPPPPDESSDDPPPPDESSDDPPEDSCFSASDTVQVLKKGIVTMKDLQVGDKVLSNTDRFGGQGKYLYEPVYSFGHFQKDSEGDFLQLHTSNDNNSSSQAPPLEITKAHLVYAVQGDDALGHAKVLRADQVQVGDKLLQVNVKEAVTVTKITKTKNKGLYMPLTPSGTIVVNDVLASNYVSLQGILPAGVKQRLLFFLREDGILLHLWLSPYRLLCVEVSKTFGIRHEQYSGEDGILSWLLWGKTLAAYADSKPLFVQVVFFGIPLGLLFGALNLMELALTSDVVPMAVLGLFVIAVYWKKHKAWMDNSEKKVC